MEMEINVETRTRLAAAAVAVALATSLIPSQVAAANEPNECAAAQAGGPVWVTADCVDPRYATPVIDSESDETSPVAHHRVSGHFEGTPDRVQHLPPARE
jgi:hypothetical protein